nr:interleukin 17B [Lateolabrax maculatus]
MTWLGLQMVSFGSLLIFNQPSSSSSSSSSSRCIDPLQVQRRAAHFERRNWRHETVAPNPQDTRSCAQAAEAMRGAVRHRSLSPWTHRIDRDDNRFPRDIAFAECVCEGCIIDGRENHSYNSRPVFAWKSVLRKIQCERNKYELKQEVLRLPVACVCVMPNLK